MNFKNPFIKYGFQLIGFSIILLLTGVLLFMSVFDKYYLPVFPFIFGFFILISYIFHAYLVISMRKKASKFVRYFMTATILKFFLYIIFIGLFLFISKKDAVGFLIFFLINYLVFTVFEILILLKFIKTDK